jgi:polyisoprenoid-binding protein YceI
MKKTIFIFSFLTLVISAFAQKKYYTKTGQIYFDAGTGIEDINATNKSVSSVIDLSTGQMDFGLLVKGFEFKNQLMEDHFHENYMDTKTFPKSGFKGKILQPEKINLEKDGTYPVKVRGILDLHGVKKEVEADGTIQVKAGLVKAQSNFSISMADFNIQIPKVVKDKLASQAKITVNCTYTVLN